LGLRGTVRRIWGIRGIKVRQVVQFTYQWRYLFLVVDSAAGQLHWCWLPDLGAGMIRGALRGLLPAQFAGLVWDRAASHRTKCVQQVGLPLIGLPAYSPELNPAERVFEEIRRAVEGKVYATLDAKADAVTTVLERFDANPAQVRSLTHWSWIATALAPTLAENAA
jgi:transposase